MPRASAVTQRAVTYAVDALRISDIILKVNDVGVEAPGGCQDMMTELKQSMDLLLLIQRQVVVGEPGMDV